MEGDMVEVLSDERPELYTWMCEVKRRPAVYRRSHQCAASRPSKTLQDGEQYEYSTQQI